MVLNELSLRWEFMKWGGESHKEAILCTQTYRFCCLLLVFCHTEQSILFSFLQKSLLYGSNALPIHYKYVVESDNERYVSMAFDFTFNDFWIILLFIKCSTLLRWLIRPIFSILSNLLIFSIMIEMSTVFSTQLTNLFSNVQCLLKYGVWKFP